MHSYSLKFIVYSLFTFIFLKTYPFEILKDTTTIEIKIVAREHKSEKLAIQYPFFGTNIELDSLGVGRATLAVSSYVFTKLSFDNINTITLLFEPEKDILLTIKDNHFTFSGKGAYANNYLLESMALIEQLRDSIKTMTSNNSSPSKFITLFRSFESQFLLYHKRYSDSIPLTREVAYLLKNNIYALLLTEKQNYLSSFSITVADSLDLENKLGLSKNILYNDTLLIAARSMDLKTLLYLHHDYEMKKLLSGKEIDSDLYPIISSEVIRSRYSVPIQEFLLFTDLTVNIQSFGLTKVLDSISDRLKIAYPSSEYLRRVEAKYKEFGYLTAGNMAPDFKVKSFNNKSFSLMDFKGKIVLIDVWATWCGSCIKSFPSIYDLQETFKNNAVVFLFISIDQDEEKWKNYLIKHPKLKENNFTVDKPLFCEKYKIAGIPRYILIDKEGKIVDAFITRPNESIKFKIANLLKQT